MTRSILVVIAVGAFVAVVAGSGCSNSGGVGDPCIPDQEYDTCFPGFDIRDVDTETKSFQCQTRVCLVNHFQGRVSCPYGQNAGTNLLDGSNPSFKNCGTGVIGGPPYSSYYSTTTSASGDAGSVTSSDAGSGSSASFNQCVIPGGSTVIGTTNSLSIPADEWQVQVPVAPQVIARDTANAVYCSCRCANDQGLTNDGSVYCSCPDGFLCTQLVTSIGLMTNEGLTGAYCMKTETAYNMSQPASCASGNVCCNPSTPPACP
jgi:hypothetical protein